MNNNNFLVAYYCKVSALDIHASIKNLPSYRKNKVSSLMFDEDKRLSIGVYLLLKQALLLHSIDINKYKWKITKEGKPYLKDCPIKFNLSHSKDYCLVALSNFEVGCDIQYKREIHGSLKDRLMKENCMNKEQFYSFFSSSEANAKCLGHGIIGDFPPKKLDDSLKIHQYNKIEDYIMSVASSLDEECIFKELSI